MRVATSFMNNEALRRMQDSSSNLADITAQITSGRKMERFKTIAAETNQLLNLQDMQSNTNQYVKNLEAVEGRLSSSENAVQGMVDLLVEAANLWTLGRSENDASVRASMAPKAEALAESFSSLFKTSFDGKYVFSGMASDQPPLTVTPTANVFPGDPPPTAYYTGDTQKNLVITNANISQTYGVTGDDMAFARMKAGLETLWFGLANNSEPDIDGAIDLLNGAKDDLSTLLGEIGGQRAGFDLLTARHKGSFNFLQEQVDNLEKVDIAEAMTLFSQEQTTLQASMMVITQLNSISLLDFIR